MISAATPVTPPLPEPDLDHVLNWAASSWGRLRGARLFITGGTGFFGTWLLESLVAACDRLEIPVEACVLTRSPERFRCRSPHLAEHRAIRLHRGDVRDFEFPEGEFTHCIHAAFPSGAPPADADETASLVIDGTRRVLELAERAKIERLLFISSGAVYASQNLTLSTQADRCAVVTNHSAQNLRREAPDSSQLAGGRHAERACQNHARAAYSEGKRLAEELCRDQADRGVMLLKIARCFAFVGPHLPLDAHFAIGNFIRDALRGGPIRVRGDGTTIRSYLYAADLAVWLWTILTADVPDDTFDVGSPEPITMAELARLVVREVSPGAEIVQERTPEQGTAVDRYVPDVVCARASLGLLPRIALPEAIRRTAAWARSLPALQEFSR